MERERKIKELISQCKNGSIQERCAAIADLQEMDAKEALPVLLELLDYPDAGVRANIACALGELGDESTGAPLLTLLKDSDSLVRIKAAESLGLLNYVDGIDLLAQVLHADNDPLVRLHAAEALGMLKNIKALPPLVKALDDPDEGVRAYAADSIGHLRVVDALPVLMEKLGSEQSQFTRAFLLSSLYRLGDENSLASLVKMSEAVDDDLAVIILNLAIELASPQNADSLKDMINEATQSRPTLHAERESLIKRLGLFHDTSNST
jgi:HEAT repeat protein